MEMSRGVDFQREEASLHLQCPRLNNDSVTLQSLEHCLIFGIIDPVCSMIQVNHERPAKMRTVAEPLVDISAGRRWNAYVDVLGASTLRSVLAFLEGILSTC